MNEFDFRDNKQAGRPPVAIVGAGPIGIEMAVRLTRIGIANEVFDAGSIGHTMSWWAPQTRWFSSNERISIAGVPLQTLDQNKATREEYLRYLRCVVDQFKLNVRTRHKVVGVDGQAGQFRLQIEASGGSHTRFASAIVLAIGGTDRARKLHVPGEQLPHVDGYLRELHGYHGRNVLVVGGRNSAVEAALRLHHVGARVTLCHRG
ncbi:MAG: NAD(P)-binding domain-containing protein, partial [Planctomycetota bacterium]